MSSQPRLPRASDRIAGIASALRGQPEALDEVTRARMERALVQAWRTRAAAHVPLPRSRSERAPSRPAHVASWGAGWGPTWAASLAIAAAAGAIVAYFGASLDPSMGGHGAAQFELRIGDAAVQRGAVAEGQVLESGDLGDIEIDLGDARIAMDRGARVRFDRLSEAELRIGLVMGRIDVAFHPQRKGEQQLIIDSRGAHVVVVGTRFSVIADAVGNTEVLVYEGVVEVSPQLGGKAERVPAGGSAYVRADEGDATERAVRAAIEEKIETLEPELEVEDEPSVTVELEGEGEATAAVESHATKLTSEVIARRLDQARALLREGRHPAARSKLRGISERGVELLYRVEALTLLAESYTAQGDMRRATEAYRLAAEVGARTPQGDNAQFALARLLERFTQDRDAAARAYERYLERAPNGALAAQARGALCRLDGPDAHEHCR